MAMIKEEKKKVKKERKKLVFFTVLFLVWFSLSQADFSGPNLLEDRDGDGLTDAEERAFGTNPDKQDSDGDGYSDGVEVRSGYDPLKPSPNDRLIVVQGESTENPGVSSTETVKTNLTEKYIEELVKEKGDYLGALRLAIEGDKETIEKNNLNELSLTEDDLSKVLEKAISGTEISEGEVLPISENEIVIIPTPKGSQEEIKTMEKKQIEKYITTLGYFVVTRAPFEINTEEEFLKSGGFFIQDMAAALMSGDFNKIQKTREKNQEIFLELKKVEVPEVIKDFHLKVLYLYKCFLEGVNEKELINQTDPIAMMLELGKIQALMVKVQDLSEQLNEICAEYEIKSFSGEGVFQ